MSEKNRHPVDELAEVRAAIKALESRESELRNRILAEGASLIGDDYAAIVTHQKRNNLDRKALAMLVAPEVLDLCTTKSDVTVVKVVSRHG